MAWLLYLKIAKHHRRFIIQLIGILCILDVCCCMLGGSNSLNRFRLAESETINQLPVYPTGTQSKKCLTPTCRYEAYSIYKRLGGYFKPCENFFLYTCGGFFMKENGPSDMENLQEKISNIIYDELLSKEISKNDTHAIQNAKTLFESCKTMADQDFYGRFKSILIEELDGWPLLGDQYYHEYTPAPERTTSNTSPKSRARRQHENPESAINENENIDVNEMNSNLNRDEEKNDQEDSNRGFIVYLENILVNSTDNNSANSTTKIELSNETKNSSLNEYNSTLESTTPEPTSAETIERQKQTLYDKFIKFFKLGINPFFRIDVDVDPFNNTKFALWIRKPVSIRFKSHQIIDLNLKALLKTLVVYLNSSCSPESIEEQVNGTIRLESVFNMLNKKKINSPPIVNVTIQKLIEQVPGFDWKLYIVDKIFNQTLNMSIDLNHSIVIHDIDNLKRSIELFNNETKYHKRDVDNFFVWELVKSMIQYFPSYNKTQKTPAQENKTASMCSRYVTMNLNFLVSKYYIEKQADSDALKGAIQMTESIRVEFINIINESEWMSELSKRAAIKKLNNMVFKIAYPEYILNDTLMDEIYRSFTFNKSDFLKNDLLIKRITNLISFDYMYHDVHRQSWKFGPALANAAYYTLMNEIYIPFGIIHAPFYNKHTLMLFNYARLGSIIGHEIAHGFDSEGRKFDHTGNFRRDEAGLWDMDSIRNYRNKTECFVRHYSNYTISNLAQKLNGVQTLEENISDNLGFKASYRAYKKWVMIHGEESLPDLHLSHDQLYFIAYAQTLCEFDTFKFVLEQNHSPNEIRLYGVVSNMKEFSTAFNCTSGEFHNPQEQCKIW